MTSSPVRFKAEDPLGPEDQAAEDVAADLVGAEQESRAFVLALILALLDQGADVLHRLAVEQLAGRKHEGIARLGEGLQGGQGVEGRQQGREDRDQDPEQHQRGADHADAAFAQQRNGL